MNLVQLLDLCTVSMGIPIVDVSIMSIFNILVALKYKHVILCKHIDLLDRADHRFC